MVLCGGFSIGYAVATVYAFVRLVRVMDPVLSLAGNDVAEVLKYHSTYLGSLVSPLASSTIY